MSQRTPEELWSRLVREEYPEDSHERIVAEAERARYEEARLLEETKANDATIKALADALEMLEHRAINMRPASGVHEIILSTAEREKVQATLRLAGRLT